MTSKTHNHEEKHHKKHEHHDDKTSEEHTVSHNKHNNHDKKLEEAIKEKDTKIAELTETCQRIQAEFENFRKRSEKENADFKKYAKNELITELLTVLDSFELALQNTSNPQEFVKGIELIHNQIKELLAKEGLRAIPALDEKCDPYLHEALLQEVAEGKDGIILEELQRGYKIGDRVLRHSKVKVGKDKTK